MPPKPHRSR